MMITMSPEHRVKWAEEAEDRGIAGGDVSASEIAAFAYCAKAWHLEHVVGTVPSATAARARAAGATHHAAHGSAVRAGSWLGRYSRWAVAGLLLLAFLLAALSVVMY